MSRLSAEEFEIFAARGHRACLSPSKVAGIIEAAIAPAGADFTALVAANVVSTHPDSRPGDQRNLALSVGLAVPMGVG